MLPSFFPFLNWFLYRASYNKKRSVTTSSETRRMMVSTSVAIIASSSHNFLAEGHLKPYS